MTIYIALLRGINVGGKNMIKMAELKRTLEAMGLNSVQTYIQSGNVLFESNEEAEPLRKNIEQEIERAFGFPAAVMIRTAEELRRIAANCPFTAEEVSQAEASGEGESLYVSLMLQEPSNNGVERLRGYQNAGEEFRMAGRELYLLFHDSIRNSKLANNLQKLDTPSTVRNWKTINKLVSLANAMEEKGHNISKP